MWCEQIKVLRAEGGGGGEGKEGGGGEKRAREGSKSEERGGGGDKSKERGGGGDRSVLWGWVYDAEHEHEHEHEREEEVVGERAVPGTVLCIMLRRCCMILRVCDYCMLLC